MTPQAALLLVGSLLVQGQGAPPSPENPPPLESDGLVVYYEEGDSLRADRIRRTLEAYAQLPGLPPGFPTEAHVHLAGSEATFAELTGGAAPEWGAGVAIPATRTIVLPLYADNRTRGWDETRVARHEWAHLGLHEFLEGLRIPRWFSEGYAEWASGGWDAGEAWRLRVAMAGGRTPPLDSLSLGWPADRASAEIAYMLSATAVEYLMAESGERGLAIFLNRWREGRSFETALRTTFGVTSGQLEGDWSKYVRRRYGWLLVLSHSVVFWAILGAMLTAMLFLRRRRNRLAMARLRATELPDDPAYWLQRESRPRIDQDGLVEVSWRIVPRDEASRQDLDEGRAPQVDPSETPD